MQFHQHDGGRAAAGFQGPAGDCAVRAVSIAMERDYREVYDELDTFAQEFEQRWRAEQRPGEFFPSSSSGGYWFEALTAYLEPFGWEYTAGPTELYQRLHLRAKELPNGPIITRLSGQYAAVIDGVLSTVYDCSRDEYFVYGYWRKKE
ncbi:hypothetical protein LCGC14_0823500 [marine sediment metagenome]|uniref:Uncharacterized protein n=1 Tax=marine sediment metagenome TaxID=412755 RepID=A0A0F9Q3B2_9ZZZZ